MAKCTGVRCPMQHGYKTEECNQTDCPWRTEPITNADRIRAMSDEELAEHEINIMLAVMETLNIANLANPKEAERLLLNWLKQPAEEDTE